jgi:hypothetical protein
LPQRVGAAAELDWSAALDAFAAATSLITIGRDPDRPRHLQKVTRTR